MALEVTQWGLGVNYVLLAFVLLQGLVLSPSFTVVDKSGV